VSTNNSKDLACQNTIEKQSSLSIDTTNYNPKAFTTRKKTKPITKDSISSSMPFSIDDLVAKQALFEGGMTHLSFDCPKNLRIALNNAVKQNGTSVCKILAEYSAAYVTATMIKKHALANTKIDVAKQTVVNVGIGELSFQQNVQNRPRRFNHNNPETVVHDELEESRCGIGDCENEATEFMIYQPKGKAPKEYKVCNLHFHDLLKTDVSGKFWRAKR
jgi:hypothetical protein